MHPWIHWKRFKIFHIKFLLHTIEIRESGETMWTLREKLNKTDDYLLINKSLYFKDILQLFGFKLMIIYEL